MNDLHLKYRPKDLGSVIGQEYACQSLEKVLAAKANHSFIFTGPSGVGKTTCARILAHMVGCHPKNILEIDAATHTGIEAMREVTVNLFYAPLRGGVKVIIVDEAHALSKAAWQSLLKIVEEPPAHVYWCFCTTEAHKIPQTIKTRCVVYDLEPIKADAIAKVLVDVCHAEAIEYSDDIIELLSRKAQGSMRQGLTFLSQVRGCRTRKEAARVLRESEREQDVINLCRMMAKGQLTWAKAMEVVKGLEGQNPESLRWTIVNYFTTALISSQSDRTVVNGLGILEAFSEPYPTTTSMYPLLLSLGQVIYAD